jgi:hypothetical protein
MMRRAVAAAGLVVGSAALLRAAQPGLASFADYRGAPYTVTYDNRSLFLNGERSLFLSAGFHYPRFTPSQWDDVYAKAKSDGFNMIQ